MAPRKVYPPPFRFSRKLAAVRAQRARNEAGPANAAPHEDEVIDISSDSDSEQVPEYVSGEGVGNELEEEEVPEYVPGAEPMEEEEDPEEVPEEDPEEEPEEDPEEDPEEEPEEDPEEEPQEEQPEAMEQDEEEEGQEMAFGWANQLEEKEEEEEEEEDINLLDHDNFVDYWELPLHRGPCNFQAWGGRHSTTAYTTLAQGQVSSLKKRKTSAQPYLIF
ncbi:hypothetical protein PIB30_022570 [Stylosanthes scabra]|uniref:Uncharacterized protein n=1 Tax=Stylosanthes scabra TaxID=79078 RepID=A0ABU6Y7T2_9FABA|nr:hypothetical protein [Stylosanthes scabra]